jgi:hypothetical protein
VTQSFSFPKARRQTFMDDKLNLVDKKLQLTLLSSRKKEGRKKEGRIHKEVESWKLALENACQCCCLQL